jgi:hypothetical protein
VQPLHRPACLVKGKLQCLAVSHPASGLRHCCRNQPTYVHVLQTQMHIVCGLTRCLLSANSRTIMGSMTRVLPSPIFSWAMGANPSGPEPSSSVRARVCCAGRICRQPSTSKTSHWACRDTSHVRLVNSSCRHKHNSHLKPFPHSHKSGQDWPMLALAAMKKALP